jgi:hypothetical protein
MHICISNILKKKYDYSYDFLYGSIMPDILKKAGGDKNKVHYRTNNDYSLYEIDRFVKDIVLKEENEYNLGYLAHLIQDKLLAKYVNEKIKESKIDNQDYIIYKFDNGSLHKKQEFLDLIHNEYAFIDNYLINKYELNIDYLTKRILRVNKQENYCDIIKDELRIHDFLPDTTLKIFSILDIEQYIRECVNEYDRYIEEEL